MSADREREVTEAFVSLVNSLVDDVDVIDLLTGLTTDCARLLDITSAGLLLADARGTLHVVAASSEATRNLDLFQLQRDQGPCLDCYRTGTAVGVADLGADAARWPLFVDAALGAGIRSVHAVPMRLQSTVLGALGLFGDSVGAMRDDDLALAQALAHVASVAIVQGRVAQDAATVTVQLQTALTSRVLLEQAKGSIAQRGNLTMDLAFAALRNYARDRNERLADVSSAVVARTLSAEAVLHHQRIRSGRD